MVGSKKLQAIPTNVTQKALELSSYKINNIGSLFFLGLYIFIFFIEWTNRNEVIFKVIATKELGYPVRPFMSFNCTGTRKLLI